MEDTSQCYDELKVSPYWKFELVGHGEKTIGDDTFFEMLDIKQGRWENGWPVDKQYPDWVGPVGKLPDGEKAVREKFQIPESVELFARLYLQPGGIVRASYHIDSPTLVKYDDRLKEKLSGYDYRRHRLFAFSRDEVIYHEDTPAEDLRIARLVLSDARFDKKDPFLRSNLSYRSKDSGLVLQELRRCVKHIGDCDFLRAWWQAEIDLVRRPEEQLGAGMPELARQLEQPGMLESFLNDNQ